MADQKLKKTVTIGKPSTRKADKEPPQSQDIPDPVQKETPKAQAANHSEESASAAINNMFAPKAPKIDDAGHDKRTSHVKSNIAQLVLQVSHEVARADSLDEQLRIIMEAVTSATDSERGTLFLNDSATNELYSRVALGDVQREIRILNNSGIAGAVYTSGEGLIIDDAYKDPRFNKSVDQATGFTTRNILCAPVRTVKGDILGVAQTLNKNGDCFSEEDLSIMQAITTQASIALQGTLFIERMEKLREQEAEFLNVVSDVSSEINLGPLLQMIMTAVTKMLQADRSTLFLNDEKTNELYTQIGQGLGATNIRLPNHLGIAGAVFTSGKTINIPYAYADLRFNPAFDKQTGYFTRSILCCPVLNKDGKVIGVTQVLNKKGGPFNEEDEKRLKAFTSQIAVGLENAQLFADVQQMKNYNESMLESMSNAVVTFDEEGTIVTCNAAGHRILRTTEKELIGQKDEDFFVGENTFVVERLKTVREENEADIFLDAVLKFSDGEESSVNITTLPLLDQENKAIGTMIMMEDISSEKRMKSTMSRYMDPGLADKLMGGGEEILGGLSSIATVLFSDVRSFTTLSEELGAQGIVSLLNEYFTIMVDCLNEEEGMLDKFIGDAMMAIFGTPFPHDDDPDRAVRCSIDMMNKLREFNEDRRRKGAIEIDIGIGLNTDNVVSGNIGSPKRMDYTVIGDGVNLAARLESGTKQYGAHILISEFTYKALRGTYRVREMDHVVVKGKTKPVGIYELLDYHTDETFPNMVESLAAFRDGIADYRSGNFEKAINLFKESLAMNPKDKGAEMYIGRCEHLRDNIDPKDWDGIWVMTSK